MNISGSRNLLIDALCDAKKYLTRHDPADREGMTNLSLTEILQEAQYAGAAVQLTMQTEQAIEIRRLIEKQRVRETEAKTKNYLS